MDDDRWVFRQGKRDGHEYAASSRDPLDPALCPGLEHHVSLTLGYKPHWRTGMPKTAEELKRLQDFEDDMIERLAATGSGELVATETTQARRTMHLYVRSGCAMLELFGEWARRDTGRKGPWVTVTHDPAWAGVAHLAVQGSVGVAGV